MSGWSLTCCEQRSLQVGAVHDPVGRAIAAVAASPSGMRAISMPVRALMMLIASGVTIAARAAAEAEVDQNAAGIGRQLHAGAGFLEPLGSLQDDDAETARGERKRGRQTADARRRR